MAHPALVAVFIGLGVAAFLYYMFIDQEEGMPQHGSTENGSGRSPNNYNDSRWNSESTSNNRRRRSSTMSSVNTDDCPICLSHLIGYIAVRVQPCQHLFHKKCIDEWQSQSLGVASCPICREPIQEQMQTRI